MKLEKDNGLRWVLYIETVIRGQDTMTPLLNDEGEIWLFETYAEAMAEKSEHSLSVVGTAHIDNILGTVYSIVPASSVT